MADSLKILGQGSPTSGSLQRLYTVPVSASAVISSIAICNTGLSGSWYNIATIKTGSAISNGSYIFYNTFIDSYASHVYTMGISLEASSSIDVYTYSGSLSYNFYGLERT